MAPKKIVVCTIITKAYLAYARVLANSLKDHNPGAELYVLLADKVEGMFDPFQEPFKTIHLEDLADQDTIREMLFYYSPYEICCALRPWLHQYILEKTSIDRWFFLDSDVLICGSMETLYDALEDTSILLQAHFVKPMPDDRIKPYEINILRSGIYNGGMVGIRRTQTAIQFILWWKKRLRYYSFLDIANGFFADQLWLNYVPLMFSNVSTKTYSQANVAWWNLHERKLVVESGCGILVDGMPLISFHFSGWSFDSPEVLSKHCSGEAMFLGLPWNILWRKYKENLICSQYEITRSFRYSYGYFTHGMPITSEMRKIYYSDLFKGRQSHNLRSPFEDHETFKNRLAELTPKRAVLSRVAKIINCLFPWKR